MDLHSRAGHNLHEALKISAYVENASEKNPVLH